MLTLVALVAGCAQDSASPPNVVPAERFVGETSKAVCEQLFRCCKPAELSGFGVETRDDCLRLFAAAGAIVGDLPRAVKDGRVIYDGAKAAACLDELAGESCGAGAFDTMSGHASCDAAIRGQVAVGAACQSGWECGGGAICVSSGDPGDPGVCVARAKAGEPCEGSLDCGEALRCDAGACSPRKRAGDACASGDECVSGVCTGGACASDTSCTGA